MENKLAIFEENDTRKMLSTLDLGKEESRVALFNATENADLLCNDEIDKEIVVKDIYFEQIPTTLEDGTQTYKYRTILFDEDGLTHATGAYGIYNSARKILEFFGIEVLHNDGVKVKISKDTRDGKTRLFLKLAK